ncbi:desulfoferrodoxin [Desulfovibrio oxyclinae]|jgi:superoxide reductase|uniref:desulfoferrodoxin n=1 Tax=Desulfovibrio oxyclinae TaxID=63560 RepID=UPI000366AC74|nr:desulfoferrodoxin [Desulfovibrio oxyclinae]
MATQLGGVYKCEACGNIVIVMHEGGGDLVCCGENMVLMQENTVDAAQEKHVPVVERDGDKVVVKVGSTAHPMEEKHYIEWIELMVGDICYTKMLKPGDAPEAEFCLHGNTGDLKGARAYCNIHGLWASK